MFETTKYTEEANNEQGRQHFFFTLAKQEDTSITAPALREERNRQLKSLHAEFNQVFLNTGALGNDKGEFVYGEYGQIATRENPLRARLAKGGVDAIVTVLVKVADALAQNHQVTKVDLHFMFQDQHFTFSFDHCQYAVNCDDGEKSNLPLFQAKLNDVLAAKSAT